MTREEAIDIFEHNWTRLENYDYTENELNEALDMAIKALEQEPSIDELRVEITALQNRCYALTKGVMCGFCNYECQYKVDRSAENDT